MRPTTRIHAVVSSEMSSVATEELEKIELEPKPLPISLSLLHTDSPTSALAREAGVDLFLPESETDDVHHFKAVVQDSTSVCLMLASFYDAHVKNRMFEDVEYQESDFISLGISRCAFSTELGLMQGEDRMDDRTAPKFNARGMSLVPLLCQGHRFFVPFILVDHIFSLREFESKFVAVLGGQFLTKNFIRAQWTQAGFILNLPEPIEHAFEELVIYTDGCCLSNGQPGARAGYGISFFSLPEDWDISSPLGADDIHTNQRAELTAILRAIEFVLAYQIPCNKVQIFTDSQYAVDGLNIWIPKWRQNGYRLSSGKKAKNADLFQSLTLAMAMLESKGIDLFLDHIPREENRKADALAKSGAAFTLPSFKMLDSPEASELEVQEGSKVVIGRNFFDEMQPLVQWTPDGYHWLGWKNENGSESEGTTLEGRLIMR